MEEIIGCACFATCSRIVKFEGKGDQILDYTNGAVEVIDTASSRFYMASLSGREPILFLHARLVEQIK
jgi:hypothetical protein